jgi:hypothetical protein
MAVAQFRCREAFLVEVLQCAAVALGKAGEDGPARRVGEGGEDGVERWRIYI